MRHLSNDYRLHQWLQDRELHQNVLGLFHVIFGRAVKALVEQTEIRKMKPMNIVSSSAILPTNQSTLVRRFFRDLFSIESLNSSYYF